MKDTGGTSRKWELIAAFAVLAFCEWFFFRNIIGTGRGALFGDRGDGRLTTLLTEHWWNFFTGKEKFSELAMFYPAEGVLGYTDLLLAYGLIHSLLRLAGINMFAAFKWTIIISHCIGTVTMYYLLKKKFRLRLQWALFGTLAFSFSDTYARDLCHTQLGAVSFLPVLLILFIGFLENYDNRKKRNLYAYALIGWFVLLTYNSWYVAYFTGMFCLVFLVVYFVKLKLRRIKVFPALKQKLGVLGMDIIGYLAFLVVLYLPFIKIYLPVLEVSSGYSYASCSSFLPELIDIINVSEDNWMLGGILGKLQLPDRGYSSEVVQGFSIILLGFFGVLGIADARKKRDGAMEQEHAGQFTAWLGGAVFTTIVVCMVLTVRLGSNGVSLWMLVYYFIPMAKSVRAAARFFLWLSFPMSVVTACLADRYMQCKGKKIEICVSTGAVILLFLSNINVIGVSQHWNLPEEMSFIAGVAPPPEDAQVFYVIDTARADAPAYIYHLDAFEIAEWYSLKTVNGYSGQYPAGWGGLWDVCSDGYEDSVDQWVRAYGLEHVYAYDCACNIWIPHAVRRAEKTAAGAMNLVDF